MTAVLPPPRELLDKYFGDEVKALYTGRVRVTGGEAGHGRASGVVRSDDGALDVRLRLPVDMGGPGGGSNPEQLLAAAYAACFHGALNLYASRMGVPTRDVSVDAAVTFARDPVDGLFLLSAEIRVAMPGLDRGVAAELIRNTERICPYAKMFRHGLDHTVVLVDDPVQPTEITHAYR